MESSIQPTLPRFRSVVPAVLLFFGVTVAALPSGDALWEPLGLAIPALLGLLFSLLFGWALRRRNLVVACLVLVYAAAYSAGTGTTALSGTRLHELHASPESVRMALWMLALFLTVVALAAQACTRLSERIFGGLVGRIEHVVGEQPAAVGLGIVLLVSFLVSLSTGTWTFYGGQMEQGREGQMRLEFMYDPALLSGLVYLFHQLLESTRKRGLIKNRALLGALLAALSLLLFLRQMRRLMLGAALFSVLLAIDHPTVGQRYLSSARRLLFALLLLTGLGFGANMASITFRQSATAFATNDVSARLGDVSQRLAQQDDTKDTIEETRRRLNYLALDALSVEYEPVLRHELELDDMLLTTFILLTPKIFYPQKYRYPMIGCETAFVNLRIDEDLPCTAQSEGFLADGPWGVLIVALTWPPVLGLAAFLLRRRSALGVTAAMHLVLPFLLIEGSAFPFVFALRQALLGCSAMLVCALVWRGMSRGPAPASAPRPARTQPFP